MPRYRWVFNSAPIAQFHLRYHWNFPRAGDSAKGRAITPIADRAFYRARIALHSLCATGALPSATLGSAPLSLLVGHRAGRGCIELYSCACDLISAIVICRPSVLPGRAANLFGTHLGSTRCLPPVMQSRINGLRMVVHRFAYSVARSMAPGSPCFPPHEAGWVPPAPEPIGSRPSRPLPSHTRLGFPKSAASTSENLVGPFPRKSGSRP